jgi:hypothetical protein
MILTLIGVLYGTSGNNLIMSDNKKLTDKELQEIASWPEDKRDAYEERAAILEYDAGFSRDEAEWLAYFYNKGV